MRGVMLMCVGIVMLMTSCDKSRVYEKYQDFDDNEWRSSEKPSFEFLIDQPDQKYNVYGNVRNSVSYPWSRFFMTYYLQDSTGATLKKELLNEFLFDRNSGEPKGESALGDLYDHQFLLLKDFQFPYKGKYKMQFEQYNRIDSLEGIAAIGLRVEYVTGQ